MNVHGRGKGSIAQRGKLIGALPVAFQVIVLIALAALLRIDARQQAMQARSGEIVTSS